MGIEKDFIRRTTPDKELEKLQQMLKSMDDHVPQHIFDEMLKNTFSDSIKCSPERLTNIAPFIKLGSLILAFILFVIFALVIFRDTPTNSKQTTPPTIEQKSTQETPNVFKKL